MGIFAEIGSGQLPRMLGFLNRDPNSRTYGCADRSYWHYRTVDFANARFQEVCLAFALALDLQVEGNSFYRSSLLFQWTEAAIRFWASMRHSDGSVDESYPNERHFCATAFSLYAATEALLRTGIRLEADLSATARFLAAYSNPDVANQVACSAAALLNVHKLTGNQNWLTESDRKLTALLAMQREDGSFSEYGGFDAGYDSLTVSLLAAISNKTGDERAKSSAERCLAHLERYLDDDGYYDSRQMSRSTQFLYPYGFAVFRPDLLRKVENGLKKNIILNPGWMDDRYSVPLAVNYLLTASDMK